MYNSKGANCIRVCWKQFTDSNIIETHGDYSITKFNQYIPLDKDKYCA